MISRKLNCIFVHVPRTGGKSIHFALVAQGKVPGVHFFARRLIAELGEHDWNSYFKFSVVRNPWDRAVSLYFHQTRSDPADKAGFRDWVLNQVKENGHPNDNKSVWECSIESGGSTGGNGTKWKCQSDWLIDYKGNLCMDHIARFENLKAEFSYICDQLNHNVLLPHENKTLHEPYTYYYEDSEVKDIVAAWHKRDIELFDYEFQGSRRAKVLV